MDKKLIKLIAIGVGLLIVSIVLMLILNGLSGGKLYTYKEVVNATVSATKQYLAANPSRYPTNPDNPTIVNYAYLVEEGYIKPASTMFKNNNANCYGEVDVYYLEANKYDYIPEITCNVNGVSNVSSNLSNHLIGDGEINVVLSGSGLYKRINGEWATKEEDLSSGASDDEIYYVYRGNESLYVKNYVMIDDMLFRIIMIDNDGNLYVQYHGALRYTYAWDNKFNVELKSSSGINEYYDGGIKSLLMITLEKLYNGKVGLLNNVSYSSSLKYILLPQDVCVGKRNPFDEGSDGAIECSKKVENQMISVLPAYLFLSASIDPNCKKTTDIACANSNYLTNYSAFWLSTASDKASDICYYAASAIYSSKCSNKYSIKPFMKISNRVQYTSGDGSLSKPYIINTSNYKTTKK